MKIKSTFLIDFHKQILRDVLGYAYLNESVTFDIIKGRIALIHLEKGDLKEEDIHYIFNLLVGENYLIPDMPIKGHYEITDKGRIFYLIKFW